MARDWFRDQVQSLGAKTYGNTFSLSGTSRSDITWGLYLTFMQHVNGVGAQFATFAGEDDSIPPIAMGSHLDSVATGGRFDGPLGVIGALEVVRSMKDHGIKTHAPIALINWTNEEDSVDALHASKANNGSDETLGAALHSIGYVGDGPNTFDEFPMSAHFEIHVEQQKSLEKAGKSVGWVDAWHGISMFEMTFHGEDGHANTYDMEGRKDALVGASKVITELERLAYSANGRSTTTNIQSGPVGACNIQSWTKIVFCVMHPELSALEDMGRTAKEKAESIAFAQGLGLEVARILHLEPGTFWPEAVDCVKRACGDKGMGAPTLTAHDSTMTTLVCPTAMVFARAKDGVSHCAKEWSTQEDCAESALTLGKAVLNFDQLLMDE
ncbi:hypothetical protein LTR08_008419 [Meristemomyces frigidus]|nr:hypothetical protein LTR08_008419 [Meristemomyces frigidus]